MRIVDRKTFLALEGEVLFAKYVPSTFTGDLRIKVKTSGNDFIYADLKDLEYEGDGMDLMDKLDKAENDPNYDIPLDLYCYGRDGMYKEDQLFAVFSRSDVYDIIQRLMMVRDRMAS